ncbi:helix-turn-helix domain-containing protein [Mycolicibacterium fortuitum]|nr:helix-turn-helix domain-containing protein [Mycolicibacterium fortuitum]
MPPDSAPTWISSEEAAEILGITPAQVRTLARRGKLPTERGDDGQRVVDRDAVEAYRDDPDGAERRMQEAVQASLSPEQRAATTAGESADIHRDNTIRFIQGRYPSMPSEAVEYLADIERRRFLDSHHAQDSDPVTDHMRQAADRVARSREKDPRVALIPLDNKRFLIPRVMGVLGEGYAERARMAQERPVFVNTGSDDYRSAIWGVLATADKAQGDSVTVQRKDGTETDWAIGKRDVIPMGDGLVLIV